MHPRGDQEGEDRIEPYFSNQGQSAITPDATGAKRINLQLMRNQFGTLVAHSTDDRPMQEGSQ